MNVANRDVCSFEGVTDREVVGGGDRPTFGTEIAGPAME